MVERRRRSRSDKRVAILKAKSQSNLRPFETSMTIYSSVLEGTIRYEFRNKELLKQATTHSSFVNDRKTMEKSDNEKLEYLGDAILNSVISILLYRKYTDNDEGFLSNARSCLVKRGMLTEVAQTISLDKHMSYGNGKSHLPRESKVLSNMMEALIGAIYLDGGFRVVSRVIRSLFSSHFDEEKLCQKNPKNVLQEYSQKRWGILPRYRLTRKRKDGFNIYVYVGKELKAKGTGKSKREAEQRAASQLLKQIEML
jgi:ribonuclease III